jgi:hypothetical protein
VVTSASHRGVLAAMLGTSTVSIERKGSGLA